MKRIYKYEVAQLGEFILDLPEAAIILTVQEQNGVGVIWAEVETDNPEEPRFFRSVFTGGPVPVGKYIGTFQSKYRDGIIVTHLYETFMEDEVEES